MPGLALGQQLIMDMKKVLVTLMFSAMLVIAFAGDPDGNELESKSSASISMSGVVIDETSGESLTGVKIIIEGTGEIGYTDFKGAFTIPGLRPGTYDITCKMVSYNEKKIENVRVDPEASNKLRIDLEPSTVELYTKSE